MNRQRLTFFIVLMTLLWPLCAQQLPKPMVPLRLVNDFTGLLSEQDQITLSNKLLDFNNQTSTQIYVVTYDDLQGYDIDDFGNRLGTTWGIGQQGKNNGLLILISPELHKMTIQTGYGLEGAVPDAICDRIIRNVLTPSFQAGEYYAGLDSATNVLMSLTRGEYTAEDYLKGGDDSPALIFGLLVLIIFIFIIVSSSRRNNKFYSPKHSIPWWVLLGSGSSKDSGWGSFSSGSGSFGGSGGGGGFGGFSGGGGGSFGGGGASGGW
ncbi:MAG: TPM domain-containing protein [Bacteroidales bacterium]|nr:TPM domain-containing protein [Bacteroidales bacterium]